MGRNTKPKARFSDKYAVNPSFLAAGRYGTEEMCKIWGPEKTFEYSLFVQAKSALILSKLYPKIVSPSEAKLICKVANLKYINPDLIREIENKTNHDIIAINTALEKTLIKNFGAKGKKAAAHINKAKTSADTTQPAKALQLKDSIRVIINSTENLRDILIEKAIEWKNIPHMDCSHLYDALPTVSGRALMHYVEMLQSGLNNLKYVYQNSIIGKWGDATGNHHSAKALGIDGIKLQKELCNNLKMSFMDASAQVPGLEFEADISYALSRISETINNIARYIAWGRSDDVNIFINANPKKKKGSSAMPHKDSKNGNPIIEEQFMSITNYLRGNLMTSLCNCEMPYARNLAASSNSRINFEDGFKYLDHGIRMMAEVIYWLEINKERSVERVNRSFSVVTSQQVMTYLTDKRRTKNPLTRAEAHDLMGKLATKAWNEKKDFFEVLKLDETVKSRLDKKTLKEITDAQKYIGESKRIIDIIFRKYYKMKTLD